MAPTEDNGLITYDTSGEYRYVYLHVPSGGSWYLDGYYSLYYNSSVTTTGRWTMQICAGGDIIQIGERVNYTTPSNRVVRAVLFRYA